MIKSLLFLFCFLFSINGFSQSFQLNDEKEYEVYRSVYHAKKNSNLEGQLSINYLNKALIGSKQIKNVELLIFVYEAAGEIYLAQHLDKESLKYFNLQLALMKKNKSTKTFIPLNEIGNVYLSTNDTAKAKHYYNLALNDVKRYKFKDSTRYKIYANLASMEQKKGNFYKALKIYDEVEKVSLALKDTTGLILSYRNISMLNFELNQFPSAIKNALLAKQLAQKKNDFFELAQIYYQLGIGYKNQTKQNQKAKYYFTKSFLISQKHQYNSLKKRCATELSILFEYEGDFESANRYLHLSKELNEQKIKQEASKELSILRMNYQQKLKEEEKVIYQQKRNMTFWLDGISIVFVLMVIFYGIQFKKLKKINKENHRFLNQIERKNKEIIEKNLQLLQSNKTIENVSKKLIDLKKTSSNKTQKELLPLLNDLKNSKKGFNYDEFEKLFKETHQDFYKRLLLKYPDLTRNEIRLCTLLKMNLSTKEISAITHQSYNSITIARHRLRKKMNLDESESLINNLLHI